jgi:hypothetical protein
MEEISVNFVLQVIFGAGALLFGVFAVIEGLKGERPS